MRFRDFNLFEAAIGTGSLASQPKYVSAVNELLKNNQSLPMGSSGQFQFQPTPGQEVNSMSDAIGGKGQNHLGKEVDQVQVKFVHKSPEIKKLASGRSTDDNTISFNAGEVAEGIHATAAFTRLITRPSNEVRLDDLLPIIERLENGKTLTLKAKEVNSDIADEFSLTVALKPEQWSAFKNLGTIKEYKKIKNIAHNIIEDANKESGRYADMYEKNEKFDRVSVIGDGVSGETETKTDINFDNETERKYKGYSIKAGSTNQIHQVGGGKVSIPAEDRFNIINQELFGVHGRIQLIDIDSAKDEFVELWNSGKYFEAYRHAYQVAVDKLNEVLNTDAGENEFVKDLVNALKFWMRRDDEGVVLKQFSGTKKGTYILDAEKLDEMQNNDLNLVAFMGNTKDPTLRIGDTKSKKVLVEIRAKGEKKKAGYYFRNLINKGPLFVQLTNINKK